MADKIKKFFAKKKADAKFKLAGPGHRLNESSTAIVGPSKQKPAYVPQRSQPSDATRQAADAALARLQNQSRNPNFNTSLAAIQAQVRRELEAEKKSTEPVAPSAPVQTNLETSPHLAVKGVYFRCPLISEEVLTKDEWKVKIKEFLFEQLEEERGLTACLIIQSCNYNRNKVKECVDVLVRYLDNIIANPQEPKFHKIRCSNATFRDKVLPVLGATDFLLAAGFQQQVLSHNGSDEEFWVFDEQNIESLQVLELLREALKCEDRVELELDRNIQVLSPAQAAQRIDLPQEFYALSPEEVKREQQLRTEAMEKQMQLRTKAMREKEELREIRKYKFALIRIRFPDGLYLQGTFSVYEKFSEVLDFVQDNLEHSGLPFVLTSPTGHKFEESDNEISLAQLKLVPATILTFQWDASVADEFARAGNTSYLKPEVMMLMQQL
ncbi:UBX domain-containing protein 6 [Tribolium castaneum]|uniref:UBX domain-containing protein 6-like Protein n=1 Tax=Tribolium castaneum TaxID=7070 RepID=D6WRT9_TRICA|nr:PREDICTED: UBX domain-containing protein 6 [Tribolium castaneum]EFA06437.1 UBX domain-containing protein 6-like Protein [Tribolium castaneum]|eukprot:XP_008195213.1 PREDICTED: UBX domain-containing protein 6 [Tribolium castaneum]